MSFSFFIKRTNLAPLILSGALLYGALPLGAETITTRETVEGKSTLITTTRTLSKEGSLLREKSTTPEGTMDVLAAPDWTMREFIFSLADAAGTMKSDGRRVSWDITVKGEKKTGSTDLKGLPWFGGFSYGLRHLMEQKKDRLVFASLAMDNPAQVTEMEFIREGQEPVNGKTGTRIKVSLTGMMSVFWSAQFWVDARGSILRYKGTYGPGTPERLIELVKEEA